MFTLLIGRFMFPNGNRLRGGDCSRGDIESARTETGLSGCVSQRGCDVIGRTVGSGVNCMVNDDGGNG